VLQAPGTALRVGVVTLFPQMVREASAYGVLGRALQKGLASLVCCDPREFAQDAHRTVDDRPYGGGPGMVGTPPPWAAAIDAAAEAVAHGRPGAETEAGSTTGVLRIHLSAQGERFDQAVARELATLPGFVLVASRYEGLDQRVIDARIDRQLSLGDFVLSGGDFAALAVIDAVLRLLPGALGDERSSEQESFASGRLDWPHYTRPVEWEGRRVPAALQGGNHAEIERWRTRAALISTWRQRPDLLQAGTKTGRALTAEENALLQAYLAEREVDDGERNC
jgi:tRNA (guanine37-N1)-methyltransferase